MFASGVGNPEYDYLREDERDGFSLISRIVALDIGRRKVRSERL